MKDIFIIAIETSILLLGAGFTLYCLISLKINTITAWFIFGGLMFAPYVLAAIRSYLLNSQPSNRVLHLYPLLTAVVVGMYILLDVIYIHPDPQGGIAVLMVPFVQFNIYLGGYAVAAYVINKRMSRQKHGD
jgi:hypothetical protein